MLDLMQQMITYAHDREEKVKGSSSEVGILLSVQAVEQYLPLCSTTIIRKFVQNKARQ
jgi:hypothetical protein